MDDHDDDDATKRKGLFTQTGKLEEGDHWCMDEGRRLFFFSVTHGDTDHKQEISNASDDEKRKDRRHRI